MNLRRKELFKRIAERLCILLTAELAVIALSSFPSRAAETVTQVNPVYEGVVQEKDLSPEGAGREQNSLPMPHSDSDSDEVEWQSAYEAEAYRSYEEAGAAVKAGLLAKQETVVLPVELQVDDPSSGWLQRVCSRIMTEAVTVTDQSWEGDYLNYQQLGYRARRTSGALDNGIFRGEISFTFTYSTTLAEEDAVTMKVKEILDELNVWQAGDYEKVKAVYDYVCSHVSYDYEHDRSYLLRYSAYVALYDGKCVCQGFASLVYRMLKELRMDVRIIPGTAGGVRHTWNIVRIGDVFYNLDATWDAGKNPEDYSYFLVCDAHLYGHTRMDAYQTEEFNRAYPMSLSDYNVSPETDPLFTGWNTAGGVSYWYENGVRQGTFSDPKGVMGDGTIRGREIYDPDSNAWYWLDAVYNGAKACNKEVWIPYLFQSEVPGSTKGKWVRYDPKGRMIKGWLWIVGNYSSLYPDQTGNRYYYDDVTGAMYTGWHVINGKNYHFDESSGVCLNY